jgi:hypothetical protein
MSVKGNFLLLRRRGTEGLVLFTALSRGTDSALEIKTIPQ